MGVSKSDFTDCTTWDFELCWEFCFIGSEGLDCVEERACSRFVTGVNNVIFCMVYYVYIMTEN